MATPNTLFSPESSSNELVGQVAIVTGGGRGIGRAIAQGLSKAGATVAVAARSPDQLDETVALISAAGGRALSFALDVTDQRAVEQMVAVVEAQLGPVDILINNAGVAGTAGPIWEVDVDEWWRCQDVDLRGPLLFARSVLPSMIARRRGTIINMSSGASGRPWKHVSAYAVSKAALNRFSEDLALEVNEYNVSVFVVNPGAVQTAMTEYASSSHWQKWDRTVSQIFEEGRDVPVDHIVRLVLLLVSGVADRLSGRFIQVQDDLAEMLKRVEEIEQDEFVYAPVTKVAFLNEHPIATAAQVHPKYIEL